MPAVISSVLSIRELRLRHTVALCVHALSAVASAAQRALRYLERLGRPSLGIVVVLAMVVVGVRPARGGAAPLLVEVVQARVPAESRRQAVDVDV